MSSESTPRRRSRSLSPTALRTFGECEKRFEFAYVLRPEIEKAPSAHLIFGNAIHAALAFLYRLPLEERTIASAQGALRTAWSRSDGREEAFLDREEEIAWGMRAMAVVADYVEQFDTSIEPLGVEEWVRATLPNDRVVAGKADRIDRARGLDRGLEVIDYKTGKVKIDDGDLHHDLGARVYALAATRSFHQPVVRVRFIFVARGIERIWNVENEDLAAIEDQLVELTDRIDATTVFHASPGPLCRWCDYASLCSERDQASLDQLESDPEVPF
jgi:putative RecB family exonuclease